MFEGGEHLKNRGMGQHLTAGRHLTEHSMDALVYKFSSIL